MPQAERLRTLPVPIHDGDHTVDFSGDGKTVFLGTTSGVDRWDAATGKSLLPWKRYFDPNFGRLTGLHSLPRGDLLLACAEDGHVYRYDQKTEKELPMSGGYAGRTAGDASRDGRYLVVGDRDGRADVWDLATGVRKTLTAKGIPISKVTMSPNGNTVALGRWNGKVELLEAATGEFRHTLQTPRGPQETYIHSLLFSPDGKNIYARNWGSRLYAWDVKTGKLGWVRKMEYASAFRPDGKELVCSFGSNLFFVDPATGHETRQAKVDGAMTMSSAVPAMAYSPDGRTLVLATMGRMLRFCDPITSAERANVEAVDLPDDPIAREMSRDFVSLTSLTFSPDGKWLATGGPDRTVRVWEVATRREVRRFTGHDQGVTSVGFGPGGQTIVSTGEDGAVYQWNPRPATSLKIGPTTWEELGSADSVLAYRAIWTLADDPVAATKLLREKVPPTKAVPADRIAQWVKQLDARRYADREAAMKALMALDGVASPILNEFLSKEPSAESRERIEKLLALHRADPVGADLQRSRAVQALELGGTTAARTLLTEWAAGAPNARLTEDAKSALVRLGTK